MYDRVAIRTGPGYSALPCRRCSVNAQRPWRPEGRRWGELSPSSLKEQQAVQRNQETVQRRSLRAGFWLRACVFTRSRTAPGNKEVICGLMYLAGAMGLLSAVFRPCHRSAPLSLSPSFPLFLPHPSPGEVFPRSIFSLVCVLWSLMSETSPCQSLGFGISAQCRLRTCGPHTLTGPG